MFIVLVPKHKECSNIHYIPIIFSLFRKSVSSQSRSFFFSRLISLKLHRVWMSSPEENMEEVEWPMNTRLKIVEVLADFIAKMIEYLPDDLLNCVCLCVNRLGPAYEGVELGIDEHTIIKTTAVPIYRHRTVGKLGDPGGEIVLWTT
ncbi:tRNA ligase [Parelaphostrongylus tenuis]|uniref:tRNA ligase n=1 Tax=Parelaphostrongylus tenuis TaxID=148309 RepID=A0AAD5R8Z8_PARTN|nr:tRNA ligase [Parelaphostrongylus tenuis]